MRLYLICRPCQNKIYLDVTAITRSEIPSSFQIQCPICGRLETYTRYDVYAESGPPSIVLGSILLGFLGAAIVGPIGALGGALLGAGAGARIDENDRSVVGGFNSS